MSLFSGVHGKLDRARWHYEAFRSEVKEVIEGYRAAIVRRSAGNGVHVYELVGAPSIPAHWSAIVGDIVHNLRSALDHLAWQLVIVSGGRPTRGRREGQPRATAFPILGAPLPAGGKLDIEGGLRRDLRDLLLAEQPYVVFSENPRKSPLYLVAEMNNFDKHVEIVPVVTVLNSLAWSSPDQVSVQFFPQPGSLVDGSEVGRHVTNPPYDQDLGATFDFEVRADETIGLPELQTGDLCGWALGVAIAYFEEVVLRFEEAVRIGSR